MIALKRFHNTNDPCAIIILSSKEVEDQSQIALVCNRLKQGNSVLIEGAYQRKDVGSLSREIFDIMPHKSAYAVGFDYLNYQNIAEGAKLLL